MSAVNSAAASDVLSQYQLNQEGKTPGGNELGKDAFMELMLAQLKNQNPLEPQDNGDFIAQLAQFSSLEEMQNLSGSVDDVVGQFRSSQALQASAMVGKTVLAPSSVGILGSEGEITGTIQVPASTGGLRLSVMNQSGELVRQIDMGSSQAGVVSFQWDGQDGNGNPLPPGPLLDCGAGLLSLRIGAVGDHGERQCRQCVVGAGWFHYSESGRNGLHSAV